MKHYTKDGLAIKLCDLSDNHLANIIKLISRRAREGLTVTYGYDDMWGTWCDQETVYGVRVLAKLRFDKYKNEEARRMLQEK